MKACQCDRCGKFYLPNNYITIAVDKWNCINWEHLDLCEDCRYNLEKWIDDKGDTNENNI